MKNTLYIALSRQTSLWNQLDMVSNNLANVNTAGYKGVQAHFTEHLSRSKTDEKLIDDRLSFTHDFGIVRDFTEGAFSSTGNPLDVAIHGDGYFVIETPQGIQYSRNGQFKLNSDGMIVNSNGILTGVLTDGDIRRTLIKYENIRPLLAKDVMSVNPKHISKTDYGASALNLMEKYSITALAVVDEYNKPIGVIHIHDLLKAGVA